MKILVNGSNFSAGMSSRKFVELVDALKEAGKENEAIKEFSDALSEAESNYEDKLLGKSEEAKTTYKDVLKARAELANPETEKVEKK